MKQIANPAGLQVLGALVELIRNTDEVEKVLAEINQARDAANEKIAVVGSIEEIERCSEQAADSLHEAKDTLARAKREANMILGEAGAAAAGEKEKRRRADALVEEYKTRLAELEAREAKVKARELEMQEDMDRARKIREDFSSLFTQ
jgi:hypothetical protein